MPYSGSTTLGLNSACTYFAVLAGLVALPSAALVSRTSSTAEAAAHSSLIENGSGTWCCPRTLRFKDACAVLLHHTGVTTPEPDGPAF